MPSDIVKKRHPSWEKHATHWRWLLDSLEGGDTYRWASYGQDSRGFPLRNLVRHKREYPSPGDAFAHVGSQQAGQRDLSDDFTLRLIRTPVPDFVAEATDKHIARIFAEEIRRDGPEAYLNWIVDVNGRRMSVDTWMRDEIARLLLTLGTLDVLVDHPPGYTLDGGPITLADAEARRLDRVEATIILPQHVFWWRRNRNGQYEEVLNEEFTEDADGNRVSRYRHWTASEWRLYNGEGELIARAEHPFGRVPQERLVLRPKPRDRAIGLSPMESTAERQREYYNRDSELMLSDTTQAHPLLQGPEDYVQPDGSVPVGPGWLLPKKKNTSGGSATYEGFEVVDFPKGAAESLRSNLSKLRDEVDRSNALTKPAGSSGMGGSTVAQSGVSKGFDHRDRNELLATLAEGLAAVEESIGRLVVQVATDGRATDAELGRVQIVYPKQFDLLNHEEPNAAIADVQAAMRDAGELPETETELISRLVERVLVGLPDDLQRRLREEIEAAIAAKAKMKEERRNALPPVMDFGREANDAQLDEDAEDNEDADDLDQDNEDEPELDPEGDA